MSDDDPIINSESYETAKARLEQGDSSWDGITRLSPINKRLGSCSQCGRAMWQNDYRYTGKFGPLYRCAECKAIMLIEGIVPF